MIALSILFSSIRLGHCCAESKLKAKSARNEGLESVPSELSTDPTLSWKLNRMSLKNMAQCAASRDHLTPSQTEVTHAKSKSAAAAVSYWSELATWQRFGNKTDGREPKT